MKIYQKYLQSPRFGPITKLIQYRMPPEFDFFNAITISVAAPGKEPVEAAGGSMNKIRALNSALGEAVERLSLSHFIDKNTIYKSREELDEKYLPPEKILYYSQNVYDAKFLEPYAPDKPLHWIKGKNLIDQSNVYVPAFVVYTNYNNEYGNDLPFDMVLSTGGACAYSLEAAVLHGLYEVIERDSFSIHWENLLAGTSVDISPRLSELQERLKRRKFNLIIRKLQNDSKVPVALAAVVDETGYRASIAIGAAANHSWELASWRATEEAILTSFWVTNMLQNSQKNLSDLLLSMENIPQPRDHAHLYGFHEMRKHAAFLWEGDTEQNNNTMNKFHSVQEEVNWLLKQITKVGGEPIIVDVTAEEVREFGLVVVRVIIPGFVPLSRGLHLRPLLNRRLESVPKILGKTTGFNRFPHPFP